MVTHKEAQMITCPKCNGNGFYEVPYYSNNDSIDGWEKRTCNLCCGSGKVPLVVNEEIQRKCRSEVAE